MDHFNSFTFIAVVTTMASIVVIAAWLAWPPDGQLMREVDKSSTDILDKTNIVPLQNIYDQWISKAPKFNSLVLSPSLPTLQIRSQQHTLAALVRIGSSSIVITIV